MISLHRSIVALGVRVNTGDNRGQVAYEDYTCYTTVAIRSEMRPVSMDVIGRKVLTRNQVVEIE